MGTPKFASSVIKLSPQGVFKKTKKSQKPPTPWTCNPTTPSEFANLKKVLKELPREFIEEVLTDQIRNQTHQFFRDCIILDAILLDRDFVPRSQAEILETQNEELMTVMRKYATYSRGCREQAGDELKRNHPDYDSDDNHPNEGEIKLLK